VILKTKRRDMERNGIERHCKKRGWRQENKKD
jgi:hypothetical protein